MKAMILAAGLGTRLRPLTNNKPKALVEIAGKTQLELLISNLKNNGFDEIIINVHHHADQIADFLKTKNNFGIRIEISFEDQLLDTGGGLKKAGWFFDDKSPFLLHNVDVLSDIDLKQMMRFHRQNQNLATLAVRHRTTSRYLLFDRNGRLVGWKSETTNDLRLVHPQARDYEKFSFMGIHVLSPQILSLLEKGPSFSIIDSYLALAAANFPVYAFPADSCRWLDLGRTENLKTAEQLFADRLKS